MFHTFQRFSLEKQLFASFVGFAAVLLLLTMGVSLILDINRQMQSTDSLIRSSASYIASLDSVKNMLKQGYPDPEVTKELDSFNESLDDLHVIVICDANSQDAGDSFVNGDQEAILQGSEPYITTGYGTHGTQRRAFHAVEDTDGTILGFVMTSVFISDIYAHIQSLILYCILLFCTALVVGAGGPAAPLPAGLPPHRTAGALSAAGGGAQRGGGRPGGHRPQRQGGLCQSDRLPAAPEE